MNRSMIMIMPKMAFDSAMELFSITDQNVEVILPKACMISIVSPDNRDEQHWFKLDHRNVLNLEFDDADPSMAEKWEKAGYPIHLFEKEDAIKIIEFVKKNNECKIWYIHCTAGVSRSGAVGSFIRQILNFDYEQFKKDNPYIVPNGFILSMICDIYSEMNV